MRDTWFFGILFGLFGYWIFDRAGLAIGFFIGVIFGIFLESVMEKKYGNK